MRLLEPLIPVNSFLPIMVLTADTSAEAKQCALAGGAKDLLIKPFDLIEVDLRIKNLLETRYIHQKLEQQKLILEEKVLERTEDLKNTIGELKIALNRAEASDRLKSAFLNNISHEIRTPLNAILGFASFLSEPDISPEERLKFNEYISTGSDRLIKTITDYVDMSVISSGNLQVYPEQVYLESLLKEIFEHYESKSIKKKLEFKLLPVDHPEKFLIHTDRTLMRKILSHVIDNAIKFTEQGGVTIGSDYNDGRLEITVTDTGIGIPQGSQNLVFESFMQDDVSNTRVKQGSGLGLSIVRGVIQKLGGTVRIDSEKGKGTAVVLTFPIQTGEYVHQIVKTKDDSTSDKPPIILIAEDDHQNYQFLEVILKRAAYPLLRASNGAEAVEFCRNQKEISLVLMDIRMPVMDGLEATQMIKSFRKDLPIIAVTAQNINNQEYYIQEGTFDDYISKPIRKEELFKAINKTIPKR